MLTQARSKPWPPGVRFERCLAQDLADELTALGLGEAVDGVFAAYLFRNVVRPIGTGRCRGLQLLRPGGVLVVQEYSVAGSRLAGLVWTLVCWLVVIPLSWLTLRRTRLYRYLWASVRDFESVQAFVDRLYAAGFVDVEVRTARAGSGASCTRSGAAGQVIRRQVSMTRSRTAWLPGRDRRAVRHPAVAGQGQDRCPETRRRGSQSSVPASPGSRPATALAERGVRVVLVEREAQLGGRVRSWPVGDHDEDPPHDGP